MNPRCCFQCEKENPHEQSYCGHCGAALALKEYISGEVNKELASAVRDRGSIETESAIRVFEKAFGWATLVARALAVPVVLVITLLGWLGWKEFDLSKSAQNAKEQIERTADTARNDIGQTSQGSIGEVEKESAKAIAANRESAGTAVRLSNDMKATASKTKDELKRETTSFRDEVTKSKSELDAIHKLQPEFDSMRAQLGQATSDLAAQQKVISSSEEFVKQVFSTHMTSYFAFNDLVQQTVIVVPPPQGATNANTVVLMLLPNSPIDGTLQLQFKVALEPPGSYFHLHNLILFFWGDPPEVLKTGMLAVSYFPDKSDKEIINALTIRDGRVYADDQPMPKFGQAERQQMDAPRSTC
jgi:hypothetical protein